MAFFEIIEGRPGQGKSLFTAYTALKILKRNADWHEKKSLPIRYLYSNIKFNKDVELDYGKYIKYWEDVEILTKIKHADIIWDEIAVHLDSRMWQYLSADLKRLISQFRKRGLDIYANTQDIKMVDINVRRVISGAKTSYKVIGSSDPSASKPEIKKIWGLTMLRDIENYDDVNLDQRKYTIIPELLMITEELVKLYDTGQDIGRGELPKLKHMVQYCELHGTGECNHVKTSHL